MAAQRLYHNLLFLFRAYLLALVLFFVYRFVYMFRILPGEEITSFAADITKAFLTGIRFDTVTICYGFVLPVVLSFLLLAGDRTSAIIVRIQQLYIVILLALFTFILIVDYYYFTYFQSHINVQIFGFLDDDTGAVMQSLWTDYPLLRVLIGIAVLIILFSWILSWLRRRSVAKSGPEKKVAIAGAVSFVALFVIGLRSSFGTFPVQMDDASVSNNARVNLLPINGVFAFKDAIVYHQNEFNISHVIQSLEGLGYPDKASALKDYLETNGITNSGDEVLYTHTDTNAVVAASPPNVVFFLLESWSNNNLYLHGKEMNLLGALEKYWNKDILFRHFLSGHNGTINSIEGMMINTPVTPVAQSEYSDVTFESSCAKPFYEKGYSTTFISGGKINWRNINNFIPRQYFQYVEGNADISKSIPDAKECEWGVYDEYVFEDVFKKLQSGQQQKQFIFALTTTNHTPFHLPDHYKPFPVNISASVKAQLKVDEEMARKNLTNLQYTNDCLGKFLDQLEASPMAQNTIVIATGDHNNLMLFDFDDAHAYYRYSVPLLVHAPAKYLQKAEVDTTRWGSHKDIFPTIYHLALERATYLNNGNDLFEKNAGRKKFFAINIMGGVAMNDDGAVRYQYDQRYFKRRQDFFEQTDQPDDALQLLMRRSKAYYSMMVYHLQEEIENHHSKSYLKAGQ